MTWSSIQLRKITLVGPGKLDATLKFRSGLNVICGASDAGKSFVVESIDFFMGGNDALRDIPERVGYDQGLITLQTTEEENYTIARSIDGGKFRLYEGSIDGSTINEEFTILKESHSHGREDNLSGWLLAKIGMLNKRLKKNKDGETRSLSFRDLARLIIIQENEIIRRTSPFLTGQYISATAEKSAFKLITTGVDDSALVSNSASIVEVNSNEAKLELISQWLQNLHDEVTSSGKLREELDSQLEKIENSIQESNDRLRISQQNLNSKIKQRNITFENRNQIEFRKNEIDDLLAKFSLLSSHYLVDLERLEAIEESGTLFYFQSPNDCPLCGAQPEHQHRGEKCEGDVERIILAAKNEKEKILKLSKELLSTSTDLRFELSGLESLWASANDEFNSLDSEIKLSLSPEAEENRYDFSLFIEKKSEILRDLDLYLRIDKLEIQAKELSDEVTDEDNAPVGKTLLAKSVLDSLSQKIESILKAWNFPNADRVYFDEKDMDFVISGKLRTSRGKGLRAITHAAVTIGLMEFCKENKLPHPGFVILDSPLLAYWAPEGSDDSLLGSDLKVKFYEYLINNHSDSQVILFENEHPPESLNDKLDLTIFTKNPAIGRFGFFPVDSYSQN